jgi:hypothetical protein
MRPILAAVLLMTHATSASALDIETYLALPETAQQFYVLGFADGVIPGFLADRDRKVAQRLTARTEQQRCVASGRTLHSVTEDLLRSAGFDAAHRRTLQIEHVVWLALERVCP